MRRGLSGYVAFLLAVGICVATASPWGLLVVAGVVAAIVIEEQAPLDGGANRREERDQSSS